MINYLIIYKNVINFTCVQDLTFIIFQNEHWNCGRAMMNCLITLLTGLKKLNTNLKSI